MAYNKKELEKKALKLIETKKLIFNADIWPLLGISQATFYNHKLEHLESIKEALEKNRTEIKSSLRAKWYNSGNFSAEITLYKLTCSDEERKKISMNYTELSGEVNTKINVTRNNSKL